MRARLKADLLALLQRVPEGRVATYGQLAQALGAAPALVTPLLAHLTDGERAVAPWWRIVADGGAIGRHAQRDAQIAALKAEGHLIAPAGIVQRLGERRIVLFEAPGVRTTAAASAPPQPGLSRARGRLGKPTSSL